MTIFEASYESMTKAAAMARADGWSGGDDVPMLDYIDPLDYRVKERREFKTKAAALKWLKGEIDARKTLFGAGDLCELIEIPRRERCQYCVCRGWRIVHDWVVDDDGIAEEREAESICHSDDE